MADYGYQAEDQKYKQFVLRKNGKFDPELLGILKFPLGCERQLADLNLLVVFEGKWQQGVYDDALQSAVIALRGTTGHGESMCGCIAQFVQLVAPDFVLTPERIPCISHNTTKEGFEGAKRICRNKRERIGVMAGLYLSDDPFRRDTSMQRWDDSDKNYGILLDTEQTTDFVRSHGGHSLLSKGCIITLVCDQDLGFPLWNQVWRRPTPQERRTIPGIRPSLEFDYRVLNDTIYRMLGNAPSRRRS